MSLANIYLISFAITFFVIRLLTHSFHDRKNYYGGTLTGVLRRLTGKEIHHIHFGFFLLIISLFLIALGNLNLIVITFLGVSTSLIADQLFPLLDLVDYFGQGVWVSVVSHLLIGMIVYLLLV